MKLTFPTRTAARFLALAGVFGALPAAAAPCVKLDAVKMEQFLTATYSGQIALLKNRGQTGGDVFPLRPGRCHNRYYTNRQSSFHFLLNNVSAGGYTGQMYIGVQVLRVSEIDQRNTLALFRNGNRPKEPPVWEKDRTKTYNEEMLGGSLADFLAFHQRTQQPSHNAFEQQFQDRYGRNRWHAVLTYGDRPTWAYRDKWADLSQAITQEGLDEINLQDSNIIMKNYLLGGTINAESGSGFPLSIGKRLMQRIVIRTFSPAGEAFENIYDIHLK